MKTKIYTAAMAFGACVGVFVVGAPFQFSLWSIAIGAACGAFLGYVFTHFPDDKNDTP